jgi:hypothetical protein
MELEKFYSRGFVLRYFSIVIFKGPNFGSMKN